MNKNHEMIQRLGHDLGLDVSRETLERLDDYMHLLQEWNQKMNLTAITEDDGIYLKHFADSLSLYRCQKAIQAQELLDVGTGAGFPGVPMKILREDLSLTLLDPLQKRLVFLQHVIDQLGLTKVTTLHGRAEDVSRETSHRDRYELVVSRAVAVLPTLMEFCMPFVRPGGYFIAMKGPQVLEERKLDPTIFQKMNSSCIDIQKIPPLDELDHHLLIIEKIGPTPNKYPRKFALIKKDNERYRKLLEDPQKHPTAR
ncbi:rRNA small subunit 7-methylguanosine (m7G) methyltransferase GidB [Clostridiaceae bacterium JG1575]|nr:rRNA small subunit 7-methylguanosine (m7G) methyltransferase GidB [Clostridiaceae bacterium JG1575]